MAGALSGPVPLDEAMGTTLRLGPDEARLDRVSLVSIALARARSHAAPPHAPEKISRADMQGPERTTTATRGADAPPGVPGAHEPGGMEQSKAQSDKASEEAVPAQLGTPALARHSAAVLDSLLAQMEEAEEGVGATVESQLAWVHAHERDEPRRPSRTRRPPDRLQPQDWLAQASAIADLAISDTAIKEAGADIKVEGEASASSKPGGSSAAALRVGAQRPARAQQQPDRLQPGDWRGARADALARSTGGGTGAGAASSSGADDKATGDKSASSKRASIKHTAAGDRAIAEARLARVGNARLISKLADEDATMPEARDESARLELAKQLRAARFRHEARQPAPELPKHRVTIHEGRVVKSDPVDALLKLALRLVSYLETQRKMLLELRAASEPGSLGLSEQRRRELGLAIGASDGKRDAYAPRNSELSKDIEAMVSIIENKEAQLSRVRKQLDSLGSKAEDARDEEAIKACLERRRIEAEERLGAGCSGQALRLPTLHEARDRAREDADPWVARQGATSWRRRDAEKDRARDQAAGMS